MEPISVTKDSTGVLSGQNMAECAFGVLCQTFAEQIIARTGYSEGMYRQVALELLSEDESAEKPPQHVFNIDLSLILKAIKSEAEKNRAKPAAEKLIERVIHIREKAAPVREKTPPRDTALNRGFPALLPPRSWAAHQTQRSVDAFAPTRSAHPEARQPTGSDAKGAKSARATTTVWRKAAQRSRPTALPYESTKTQTVLTAPVTAAISPFRLLSFGLTRRTPSPAGGREEPQAPLAGESRVLSKEGALRQTSAFAEGLQGELAFPEPGPTAASQTARPARQQVSIPPKTQQAKRAESARARTDSTPERAEQTERTADRAAITKPSTPLRETQALPKRPEAAFEGGKPADITAGAVVNAQPSASFAEAEGTAAAVPADHPEKSTKSVMITTPDASPASGTSLSARDIRILSTAHGDGESPALGTGATASELGRPNADSVQGIPVLPMQELTYTEPDCTPIGETRQSAPAKKERIADEGAAKAQALKAESQRSHSAPRQADRGGDGRGASTERAQTEAQPKPTAMLQPELRQAPAGQAKELPPHDRAGSAAAAQAGRLKPERKSLPDGSKEQRRAPEGTTHATAGLAAQRAQHTDSGLDEPAMRAVIKPEDRRTADAEGDDRTGTEAGEAHHGSKAGRVERTARDVRSIADQPLSIQPLAVTSTEQGAERPAKSAFTAPFEELALHETGYAEEGAKQSPRPKGEKPFTEDQERQSAQREVKRSETTPPETAQRRNDLSKEIAERAGRDIRSIAKPETGRAEKATPSDPAAPALNRTVSADSRIHGDLAAPPGELAFAPLDGQTQMDGESIQPRREQEQPAQREDAPDARLLRASSRAELSERARRDMRVSAIAPDDGAAKYANPLMDGAKDSTVPTGVFGEFPGMPPQELTYIQPNAEPEDGTGEDRRTKTIQERPKKEDASPKKQEGPAGSESAGQRESEEKPQRAQDGPPRPREGESRTPQGAKDAALNIQHALSTGIAQAKRDIRALSVLLRPAAEQSAADSPAVTESGKRAQTAQLAASGIAQELIHPEQGQGEETAARERTRSASEPRRAETSRAFRTAAPLKDKTFKDAPQKFETGTARSAMPDAGKWSPAALGSTVTAQRGAQTALSASEAGVYAVSKAFKAGETRMVTGYPAFPEGSIAAGRAFSEQGQNGTAAFTFGEDLIHKAPEETGAGTAVSLAEWRRSENSAVERRTAASRGRTDAAGKNGFAEQQAQTVSAAAMTARILSNRQMQPSGRRFRSPNLQTQSRNQQNALETSGYGFSGLQTVSGLPPVELACGPTAQELRQAPPQSSGTPSNFMDSEYIKSLPGWAQRFLKSGAAERAPMHTAAISPSARDISILPKAQEQEQIDWRAPGRNQRPAEMNLHKKEEQEESKPAAAQMSEAELRRTADKIYRMIEDRLRRERRRLGL